MTFTNRALGFVALVTLTGHAGAAPELTIDPSLVPNAVVRYRDQSQVSEFPAAAVYFRAAGLATGASGIAGRQGTAESSRPCFPPS